MTEQNSESADIARSWDNYWQGARHGEAYTGGGSSHPAILSFWSEFFGAMRDRFDVPAIVDVACGNGALADAARDAFGDTRPQVTCVDVSDSAIATLAARFPSVRGIVADARALPLRSASCDIAVSQFGVEYAGLDAVAEARRLLASGGHLALLLHYRGGGIHRQCEASRDALVGMRQARFVPLALAMFDAAFRAMESGDRTPYRRAASEFAPAIRAMEAIMRQYGRRVADDTIVRLYRDVRTVHERLSHYEPAEVLGWLGRMADEVDAYVGRMASMCDVAIDARQFDTLCRDLGAANCEPLRAEPLVDPAGDVPLAWALIARAA